MQAFAPSKKSVEPRSLARWLHRQKNRGGVHEKSKIFHLVPGLLSFESATLCTTLTFASEPTISAAVGAGSAGETATGRSARSIGTTLGRRTPADSGSYFYRNHRKVRREVCATRVQRRKYLRYRSSGHREGPGRQESSSARHPRSRRQNDSRSIGFTTDEQKWDSASLKRVHTITVSFTQFGASSSESTDTPEAAFPTPNDPALVSQSPTMSTSA